MLQLKDGPVVQLPEQRQPAEPVLKVQQKPQLVVGLWRRVLPDQQLFVVTLEQTKQKPV